MKKVIVVFNAKNMSNADLALFCEKVVNRIPTINTFESAVSFIPKAKALLTEFKEMLGQNTSDLMLSQIDDKRIQLERLLKLIAATVEHDSEDNEAIALSSGFEIKKSKSGSPSKGFSAEQGATSGTVDLDTKAEKRSCYIWYYCEDPLQNNAWQQDSVTLLAKHQIVNLKAGTKYWFKVVTQNSKNEKTESDPHLIHVV